MNDIKEMVRGHAHVDEDVVDEVDVRDARLYRQTHGQTAPGRPMNNTSDQLTGSVGSVGEARDGAAPGRPAQNTGGQLSTSVGKSRDEAGRTFGRGKKIASDQLTGSYGSVGEARDGAAAMMNVSPASVERRCSRCFRRKRGREWQRVGRGSTEGKPGVIN